jgi:membrane-bound metal-dependent hydrolase YbcI (DUF457 family)
MLLGHFGVALAAKRLAPRTSLGTLILAAQFLDLLWPIFLLLGWERVQIRPGLMRASPFDFEHYPISHSLLAALIWSAVVAAAYVVFRRYPRGAAVIALVLVSHWFLDVAMHRPDLPLWPGLSSPLIGFGLWNSIGATVLVELAMLGAGVAVFTGVTSPRDRIGTGALAALVAFLVVIFAAGLIAPPPPSARAAAFLALGLWLLVAWGSWIDRHREPRRLHGRIN